MNFKGVNTEIRKGSPLHYYRRGKGARIRLPDDKSSEEFVVAVRLAATMGQALPRSKKPNETERRRNQIGRSLNEAIAGAKQRAKKRNLSFDIDIEWALAEVERQELRCLLTGIPFFAEMQKAATRETTCASSPSP